jgi:hypothetical protein
MVTGSMDGERCLAFVWAGFVPPGESKAAVLYDQDLHSRGEEQCS